MRFFVGVTNNEWFEYLAARNPDEVNFWRPRSQLDFRAIPVGAPFLFKLHAPLNFIAGGGYFVRHTFLPLQMAWQAFGDKNGMPDLATFRRRMLEHRTADELGRQIGCTILTQPFFFPATRGFLCRPNGAQISSSGDGTIQPRPSGSDSGNRSRSG